MKLINYIYGGENKRLTALFDGGDFSLSYESADYINITHSIYIHKSPLLCRAVAKILYKITGVKKIYVGAWAYDFTKAAGR